MTEIDLPKFFTETELRKLIGQEFGEAPEPQLDRAAELQKKWGTERGQIWEISRHRLMCGDSTSESEIVELMCGHSANLLVTDPPYNVAQLLAGLTTHAMVESPGLVCDFTYLAPLTAPDRICHMRL